ncbi:Leucine-rich repeat [Arabidopsis thaliana x Arabidopsis arenosa]|uniref:Leucine-rich repeat n=1 Tax=Arabidopsis thaliana x Arabidopsis arenosa TaxID=1240361 RepID=A0A8T2A431_9BRAS|nr:Leucine-rich repeat [Arabidopsis thaliana x Arabidopsis arenosa]
MSSSFSLSDSSQCNYDVFLSFRGEDTRKTIVSHLYTALEGKGINTFKDDQRLETGDHISDKLHRAIQGSKSAVVVLSENYATSRWCLMELQLIMAFYKLGEIKVFPIFYGVDPSDVRHQRGSFGLGRYQDQETTDKVLGWREALNLVAGLKGVDSRHCVDDAVMLQGIVEDISSHLDSIQPTPLDDVLGVEAHIEQMKHLLKIESDHEVHMIGLWGMGGIGKTTIAKCLYERFGRKFPAHCFIEKVDQTCKDVNLRFVQNQFFCDILRIRQANFRAVDCGETLARSRLGTLKAFIVLDGVERVEQLHALAKETSWFGRGSRIIITTRDKKLLETCSVTTVHEVRCLEKEESLKMLKHFAFPGGAPPFDAYEELVIRASRLAQGLPFALVAFGLFLCRITSIEGWEDALKTFETAPDPSIMDVLKSSYMNLDLRSKTIFLKIACLFNGEPLRRVSGLLGETETRITNLADKSLIHISNGGFIEMHSLIQQVGREIVLEESMFIPRQQKMLWDPLGYDVLKSKTGTEKTEGMKLHICELPQAESSIDEYAFDNMHNLVYLKFFKHLDDVESKLDLISDDYILPSTLRLLHWDAYPLTTLSPRFPVDCLVELHLRYSNLESLWDGTPFLLKLRMLDVTGSKNLRKLPDFSSAPKLEELITKGCMRLERFPDTIGSLSSLKKLDVSHCDCLMDLEMIIGELPTLQKPIPGIFRQVAVDIPDSKDTLNSLTDISIQGKLHFWLSSLRGKAAHLSFSCLQRVPYGHVHPRVMSELYGFKSLDIMRFNYKSDGPSFKCYSFSKFPYLTELNLINLNIQSIPDDIGFLRELQKLDLSGNDFTYLPEEMVNLSKMKSLRLFNCCNIQKLPKLIQLETLKLSDCIYLSSLLDTSATKRDGSRFLLQKLWLNNCKTIPKLSDTLSHCTNLTYLDLSRNDIVAMPASIRLLPLLRSLYLNDCKKLKSLSQISPHLTSLYASGCSSLDTIYLPLDHSLILFDLSYCPSLKEVEPLINRFLPHGRNKEVSQHFACIPGSRVPSYFNNQATSLPHHWHSSESVGFDACIIIACESPFHIQLSSSSYSCTQEDNRTYRINLKPDIFLPSESTTSKGEAISEHHMFIFHVPGNINVHEFCLEPQLELSHEFQSAPVKIISYAVRVIPKTGVDAREHYISCREYLSEVSKPENVDSAKDTDEDSISKGTTDRREITEMSGHENDQRKSKISSIFGKLKLNRIFKNTR